MRPLGPFALAALLLLSGPQSASPQSGRLTGTVEIGLAAGTIAAELCLKGVPAAGDTLRFLLHRGMTVKRIRDAGGTALPHMLDPQLHGVGLRYAVPARRVGGAGGANAGVCVEYTGAFPLYHVEAGDFRASDGSDVIAFNGRTLRARGETRWYPVPYDRATDQGDAALKADLRIRCDGCERLYLNGGGLQQGPEASFTVAEPRELLILAGDFPAQVVDGVLIAGEQVTAPTARRFIAQLHEIQHHYEELLRLPFGAAPDLLRLIPVRQDRRGQLWGFFSDPALGLVGFTVADFAAILGDRSRPEHEPVLGFIAHELAHRYFPGAMRGPYSELFSEPFATYLALEATRHFVGESAYRQRLEILHRGVMEGPELVPPDLADPADLGTDAYRYRYLPLLLVSLERTVGREWMRHVLRSVLTTPVTPETPVNYGFLRTAGLRAGLPEAVWQGWEERCLRTPIRENRCLQELLDDHPEGFSS